MRPLKSIGPLGWLAVGCSIASLVITITVDEKWIRVGCEFLAAALLISWSLSLARASRGGSGS
jgi:hypothetical protein